MYYVEQSASFEAITELGITGLVGTLAWRIEDNQGNIVGASTTAGIVESGVSGFYQGTRTAPATVGQYSIVWTDDGSYTDNHTFPDDLTVVPVGAGDALPPISPIGPGPGAVPGPCNAWVTEEQVAACCDAEVGTDYSVFEEAATSASRSLWERSGRIYSGTCDRTVRPCATTSGCGVQVLSRGYVVHWNGYRWRDATGLSPCSCTGVSEVLLWYPVREVVEVKIDGDIVDSGDYFVYDRRKLVRRNGTNWPACQNLTLPDTEDGTWSVRFTYGQNPPQSGIDAAAELACEIYKSCLGLDCALPVGATRITRQGVTIERQFFQRDSMTGAWRTGLRNVDFFLNSVNSVGLRRRPAVWSSSGPRYARPEPV